MAEWPNLDDVPSIDDEVSPVRDGWELRALVEKAGGRCWYCGCVLTAGMGDPGIKTTATRDHLNPRSRGGNSRRGNLVIACRGCNSTKRARTLDEYRAKVSADLWGGAPVRFFGELR